MSLFFKDERDKDFLDACERIRQSNKDLSASEIAIKAIYTETCSFYLTMRGYANIIIKLRCSDQSLKSTRHSRNDMFVEIHKRMIQIPDYEKLSSNEIARRIDEQPAPRFYISEERAITIYYKLLNKKKDERNARARADFFNRHFTFN